MLGPQLRHAAISVTHGGQVAAQGNLVGLEVRSTNVMYSWCTGGGLAGLAAANKLAQNNISVTVYDMGHRGPGLALALCTLMRCKQAPSWCYWTERILKFQAAHMACLVKHCLHPLWTLGSIWLVCILQVGELLPDRWTTMGRPFNLTMAANS